MKKITTLFICSLLSVYSYSQEQRNCHSDENLEYRKSLDPNLETKMIQIENSIQRKILFKTNDEILTIPVVVHIVYNNDEQNISDAQIMSQIEVLNKDFRRTNSDATTRWSQAADTKIEFKLASIDPNGNATNGITRKFSNRTSWGTTDDIKKTSKGGVAPWNTSEYLNIWVCNMNGVLGYAQYPGGTPETDGIVVGHRYFGSVDTNSNFNLPPRFNKGRTATHEVGHFLGLRHIWGNSTNCNIDDLVDDTPKSNGANYRCQLGSISCDSEDMVENYMDYSDDSCMNLFTEGQKNRMRAYLGEGNFRYSLTISNKFNNCEDSILISQNIPNGGISNQSTNISITATNTIHENAFVNYKAGEKIYLKPGFKTIGNVKFKALIGPCNGYLERKTSSLLSKKETTKEETIKIYPNPFDNTINIKTTQKIIYWKLVNIEGLELKRGTTNVDLINTSNLSSGIYFIEIMFENHETIRKKLLKVF
ncbi:M43 family zinc metalloprotease [uncultured Tenacibaculum sp.]|uniref:M43 family zinc metalloprotease n=1 Tax=uncultured Tenacibaculum sp. TaxID=174713 RepID=UPI0026313E4C|nr:M43 family zinc metalloprotease [uncultured Tenacibaculum sp.]